MAGVFLKVSVLPSEAVALCGLELTYLARLAGLGIARLSASPVQGIKLGFCLLARQLFWLCFWRGC